MFNFINWIKNSTIAEFIQLFLFNGVPFLIIVNSLPQRMIELLPFTSFWLIESQLQIFIDHILILHTSSLREGFPFFVIENWPPQRIVRFLLLNWFLFLFWKPKRNRPKVASNFHFLGAGAETLSQTQRKWTKHRARTGIWSWELIKQTDRWTQNVEFPTLA